MKVRLLFVGARPAANAPSGSTDEQQTHFM